MIDMQDYAAAAADALEVQMFAQALSESGVPPSDADIAKLSTMARAATDSINASARSLYELLGCPYGPTDDDMRAYLQDSSDEFMRHWATIR